MITEFVVLPKNIWEELVVLKQLIGEGTIVLQISEMIIELLVEAIPIYSIRMENERQLNDVSILLLNLFNVEEIVL